MTNLEPWDHSVFVGVKSLNNWAGTSRKPKQLGRYSRKLCLCPQASFYCEQMIVQKVRTTPPLAENRAWWSLRWGNPQGEKIAFQAPISTQEYLFQRSCQPSSTGLDAPYTRASNLRHHNCSAIPFSAVMPTVFHRSWCSLHKSLESEAPQL